MSDGVGIAQFLNALGEMARGAARPTVPPVWNREILRPREKPTVEFPHHEYDQPTLDEFKQVTAPQDEMSIKSFFFGLREIESLKRQVEGSKCTTFEAVSACLWQSRTKALNLPSHQDLRLLFALNARSRFQPPLPAGFYGNTISFACAQAKAGDLSDQPLSFVVKLIKESTRMIDEEYMRSVIDMMEVKGRPLIKDGGFYFVSEMSKLELGEADFGWGKPVYVGVGKPPTVLIFTYFSRSYLRASEGIVIPVYLSSIAMGKFEENVNKLMNSKRPQCTP